MITPDGAGGDERRSGPGRRGLLLGLVGFLVVGVLAVGVLTSRDPAAPAATSTTGEDVDPPVDVDDFSVSQIAVGDPLEWRLSMEADDSLPLAVLERGQDLYLFGRSGAGDGGGLSVWRSGDGTEWEPLGQEILGEGRIVTVGTTPDGFVAAGTRLEDHSLVAWESEDGIEWIPSQIAAGTNDSYFVDEASAVGGDESTLVVASTARYDRERLLEDRLADMGVELDLSGLGWSLRWLGAEGQALFVVAPLGIPILRQPIGEMGLTQAEEDELLNELTDPLGTDIWVRRDGSGWEHGSIGDTRSIETIVTEAPGRRLIAFGQGASGRVEKVSADGIVWESAGPGVRPRWVQQWNGRWIGIVDAPDLLFSEDAETWQALGLIEHFPSAIGWSPTSLGSGEGGIAISVGGTRPLQILPPQVEDQELTAIDGSTFTLRGGNGLLRIISRGGRQWTVEPGGRRDEDPTIEANTTERTVTLRDPETGTAVATFTFAELERAQISALYDVERPLEAMVFTDDGEDWIIQDMAPVIGDRATISLLEVTDDRVVAVTTALYPGYQAAGFQVWSAPLP